MKMKTEITTREARQELFKLSTESANTLRRELFEIEDQDDPLPDKYDTRYTNEVRINS